MRPALGAAVAVGVVFAGCLGPIPRAGGSGTCLWTNAFGDLSVFFHAGAPDIIALGREVADAVSATPGWHARLHEWQGLGPGAFVFNVTWEHESPFGSAYEDQGHVEVRGFGPEAPGEAAVGALVSVPTVDEAHRSNAEATAEIYARAQVTAVEGRLDGVLVAPTQYAYSQTTRTDFCAPPPPTA